jgi:RsiW-degrading membrane proteinase PrsW (M82 family)
MPILTLFIFGLLASLGALLVELLVASFFIDVSALNSPFVPTIFSLLLFALIEESFKIAFFLQASRRLITIPRPLTTGLVYGLGFASLEYFALSLMHNLPTGPIYGILLVHLATSILLVKILPKYQGRKALISLLGLFTALHFGYNILL